MKKISLIFIILFLFTNLFAKESGGIMDDFKAKQVAEHTWVILGPTGEPSVANRGFMNNPAFVITDKSVIVFDPGSSKQVGEALVKKIRKHTDKPITHIFDSHVHGDHWLGNQGIKKAFPKVKIYAHPVMIEEARAGEAESWIKLMDKLTEGATAGTEAVIPENQLKDGEQIKIDNITIKSHLSEIAHTKTDAMFEIMQDKVLVTGDNAFNNRMPRLDDGSYKGNMKAIDTALALDVSVVIPGHGETGGKEVLTNFKKFLSTIYTNVQSLLDEDMEAFEMKPLIIEKLQDYKNWDNFDGAIGKLISIAVLEVENE